MTSVDVVDIDDLQIYSEELVHIEVFYHAFDPNDPDDLDMPTKCEEPGFMGSHITMWTRMQAGGGPKTTYTNA